MQYCRLRNLHPDSKAMAEAGITDQQLQIVVFNVLMFTGMRERRSLEVCLLLPKITNPTLPHRRCSGNQIPTLLGQEYTQSLVSQFNDHSHKIISQ